MINEDYLINMSEVMNDYYFNLNHIFCDDEIIPIIVDKVDCV